MAMQQYFYYFGANYLAESNNTWSWAKNLKYLKGVVKRGDDVVFSGRFIPAKLEPNSVLAREIEYLTKNGYKWTDDFSKMIKP